MPARSPITTTVRGLLGAAALALGYLAVTAVLLWGTAGAVSAVRAPGPAPVDARVAVGAALGAWVLLTWLTGVTLAALLAAALAGLGSRTHERALALAPPASRSLVSALLGLTVVTGPLAAAVPAGAEQRPASVAAGSLAGASDRRGDLVPAAAPLSEAGAPDLPTSLDRPAAAAPAGWTPDRPAAVRRSADSEAAVRLVSGARRTGLDVADEVVVRRGDTLWDIAARHLGAAASAAEVAREWPRWYVANREVIGADPDLLLPGERLVPASSSARKGDQP